MSSQSAASWSTAGDGEHLWFLGTLATIRVPGESVGDRYALIEFVFPGGASPPVHTHPQDESYIVLEGELTIQAGDDRFALGPGGVASVPMGVPHTFLVESKSAHVLVISTPAGLERMIRDASVPATARLLPPKDTARPSPEELDVSSVGTGRSTSGRRSLQAETPRPDTDSRRSGGNLEPWRIQARRRPTRRAGDILRVSLPVHRPRGTPRGTSPGRGTHCP